MNRRDVLKISAAVPAVAGAQQMVAQVAPAASPYKPEFFTPEQNETVIVLTELIIPATDTPGAKAAKVNEWMDKLLAAGADRERERFTGGLAWLEKYSQAQHGAAFVKLTRDPYFNPQ